MISVNNGSEALSENAVYQSEFNPSYSGRKTRTLRQNPPVVATNGLISRRLVGRILAVRGLDSHF